MPLFSAVEMRVGQIQQIRRAGELYPAQLDEVDGQQGCNGSEEEGAEDAVLKGFLLLVLRQSEDENGQNQRIVST